jgi:hypothetical protein
MIERDEFGAAKIAYRKQIIFGNTPNTAMGLATIVYLRRHPRVPVNEARARIVASLGKDRDRFDRKIGNEDGRGRSKFLVKGRAGG